MEPPAIAALLRIDVSTVATYILQAIRVERFLFDETRTLGLVPLAPWGLRELFERLIRGRVRARVRGELSLEKGREEAKGAVK